MATDTVAKSPAKSEKRKNAWKNLPDVWALIKPRRGLLALGFVLMAVNRVAGLVLPGSMKYLDRKSTRLNSSHQIISYAVFCLKKKKTMTMNNTIGACQR